MIKKGQRCPKVKNGDTVLVHDDSLPRNLWKLGCIQEMLIGCDGLARSAVVSYCKNRAEYIGKKASTATLSIRN